jgi:hypothetical protein
MRAKNIALRCTCPLWTVPCSCAPLATRLQDIRGSQECPWQAAILRLLVKPEVCENNSAVSLEEDVALLKIQVNYPLGVHMLKAKGHLLAHFQVSTEHTEGRKPILAQASCGCNSGEVVPAYRHQCPLHPLAALQHIAHRDDVGVEAHEIAHHDFITHEKLCCAVRLAALGSLIAIFWPAYLPAKHGRH